MKIDQTLRNLQNISKLRSNSAVNGIKSTVKGKANHSDRFNMNQWNRAEAAYKKFAAKKPLAGQEEAFNKGLSSMKSAIQKKDTDKYASVMESLMSGIGK